MIEVVEADADVGGQKVMIIAVAVASDWTHGFEFEREISQEGNVAVPNEGQVQNFVVEKGNCQFPLEPDHDPYFPLLEFEF